MSRNNSSNNDHDPENLLIEVPILRESNLSNRYHDVVPTMVLKSQEDRSDLIEIAGHKLTSCKYFVGSSEFFRVKICIAEDGKYYLTALTLEHFKVSIKFIIEIFWHNELIIKQIRRCDRSEAVKFLIPFVYQDIGDVNIRVGFHLFKSITFIIFIEFLSFSDY